MLLLVSITVSNLLCLLYYYTFMSFCPVLSHDNLPIQGTETLLLLRLLFERSFIQAFTSECRPLPVFCIIFCSLFVFLRNFSSHPSMSSEVFLYVTPYHIVANSVLDSSSGNLYLFIVPAHFSLAVCIVTPISFLSMLLRVFVSLFKFDLITSRFELHMLKQEARSC